MGEGEGDVCVGSGTGIWGRFMGVLGAGFEVVSLSLVLDLCLLIFI